MSDMPPPDPRATRRIALIHATRLAIEPIETAFATLWPEARPFHLLESSLTTDRVETPAGSATLDDRFVALARYAEMAGAGGILFTCSAFGPQIEAAQRATPLPVLKPNESMLLDALQQGRRIGLLATFEPSLAPMEHELRTAAAERGVAVGVTARFVPDAMDTLDRGDVEAHDRRIAQAARELTSLDVLLLAQFSMARARPAVAAAIDIPVLTSPGSAVTAMRRALSGTAARL